MARSLAVVFALALLGCDSCGSDDEAGPDAADAASVLRAPEPWTMGAARQRGNVVLPPPCSARDDVLRAVLSRHARIAGERHTLGLLLVAEGGAPRAQSWRHDAAGLMTMAHGPTSVRPIPWPESGPVVAARAGDSWLIVHDRTRTTRQLLMWRDGVNESLGGPTVTAVDLACRRSWCALLTSRLDHAVGTGATVWLGAAEESVLGWQRIDVAPQTSHKASPFAVEAVPPTTSDAAPGAVVVLRDELRLRFVQVQPGQPAQVVAALQAPFGAVAALAIPSPVAMTMAAALDPRRCSPAAGGVAIEVDGHARVHLRTALPAVRGSIHRIEGGMLATWLAPPRCDSPRRLLYAAVLHSDGAPVAPVTTVGEADGYAVATDGSDVDLWLRHGASNMVSWVQASCRPLR